MNENKWTVIIPIVQNKVYLQELITERIFKYLQCKKIIFIGSNKVCEKIHVNEKVNYIDEDLLYEGLSYESVQNELILMNTDGKRTGWYLQQFIKMAYSMVCADDFYIVWDSDLIPLREIKHYDEATNKYLFTMKQEFHKPYFDTINVLFQGSVKKTVDKSFIAEQMIISRKIMQSLITEIGNDDKMFWKKILHSCNVEELPKSGFSEFETYGNYVFCRNEYKNIYNLRTLSCCRKGGSFIGIHPSNSVLTWASKDLDMISIEINENPHGIVAFFYYMSKYGIFRRLFSIKECMSMRKYMSRVYRKLRRDKTNYIEFD